ncbi:hypothetical protein QBC38DRAFT_523969 [Podospora fimiseda]|uniref:Uncharacterized protein n=1 Tax=Podospora fimiseda TaxID=252190 RepID=A0AAN6YKX6_9PEZI|nr:hypothetical protein QBC38DRAFT_523969 [Podospora fimiseda]
MPLSPYTSKPGASAVATSLTHQSLGLRSSGTEAGPSSSKGNSSTNPLPAETVDERIDKDESDGPARYKNSTTIGPQRPEKGLVVVLDNVFEQVCSLCLPYWTGPGIITKHILTLDAPGLSLTKGFGHKVSVYETYEEAKSGDSQAIATGIINLGEKIFADCDAGVEEHTARKSRLRIHTMVA